jgi:hypothetical protein
MCPMTDQLTAGPGSGDDAIHEVSALFVVSRRRARALVFGEVSYLHAYERVGLFGESTDARTYAQTYAMSLAQGFCAF